MSSKAHFNTLMVGMCVLFAYYFLTQNSKILWFAIIPVSFLTTFISRGTVTKAGTEIFYEYGAVTIGTLWLYFALCLQLKLETNKPKKT